MTREEQLDWLCRLRSEIYVYMPKEWLNPMKNALDMTIKELEQKPATKNDLGVDCISREAVNRIINKWLSHSDYELKDHIYSMTEKIHNLPSVTPQEPKSEWKHDHEILKAYSNGANEILDKIRAEIGKSKTKHEMQIAEKDIKAKLLISNIYCDIVNILDKCKAESEG